MSLASIHPRALMGLLLCAGFLLSACGGGGGGGGTAGTRSVSAAPLVLNFEMESGAPLPPAQELVVNWGGHPGELLYAGLAAEFAESENWLDGEEIEAGRGRSVFAIRVHHLYMTPGTYDSVVRLIVGSEAAVLGDDPSTVAIVDVPVHFVVRPSRLALTPSASQVLIRSPKGAPLPAPTTLRIDYVGDEFSLETTSLPAWIQLIPTASGSGFQEYAVGLNEAGLSGDSASTLLRFRVRHRGGWFDQFGIVEVRYALTAPFDLLDTPQSFVTQLGSSNDLSMTGAGFTIEGSELDWEASSDQAWVRPAQAQGNAPGFVRWVFDTAGLPAGDHVAHVTVSDRRSGRSETIVVTLQVLSLQLLIDPPDDFFIDPDSVPRDLEQVLRISNTAEGDFTVTDRELHWTVRALPAWLQVSPSSGNADQPVNMTLRLNPKELRRVQGEHISSQLEFEALDARGHSSRRAVPVSVHRILPRTHAVGPRAVIANQPLSVIVGGHRAGSFADNIRVGDLKPSSFEYLSADAARISLPGLPAGDYPVQVLNTYGPDDSLAVLSVRDPSTEFASASFALAGSVARLLYDEQRTTVWTVDSERQRLAAVVWDGFSWAEGPQFSIPGLKDAGLTFDRARLLAATADSILELDLDHPQAGPQVTALYPYPDTGALVRIEPLPTGIAWAISRHFYECCGERWSYRKYRIAEHELPTPGGRIFTPASGSQASGDGGLIFLESPDGSVSTFDPLAEQVGDPVANRSVDASSADGGRLSQGDAIMNTKLKVLGRLPQGVLYAALSADTSRAYGYRPPSGAAPGQLVIADLQGTRVEDRYPERSSIDLSEVPGDLAGQMLLSADERLAILAGEKQLVLVPLPAP